MIYSDKGKVRREEGRDSKGERRIKENRIIIRDKGKEDIKEERARERERRRKDKRENDDDCDNGREEEETG